MSSDQISSKETYRSKSPQSPSKSFNTGLPSGSSANVDREKHYYNSNSPVTGADLTAVLPSIKVDNPDNPQRLCVGYFVRGSRGTVWLDCAIDENVSKTITRFSLLNSKDYLPSKELQDPTFKWFAQLETPIDCSKNKREAAWRVKVDSAWRRLTSQKSRFSDEAMAKEKSNRDNKSTKPIGDKNHPSQTKSADTFPAHASGSASQNFHKIFAEAGKSISSSTTKRPSVESQTFPSKKAKQSGIQTDLKPKKSVQSDGPQSNEKQNDSATHTSGSSYDLMMMIVQPTNDDNSKAKVVDKDADTERTTKSLEEQNNALDHEIELLRKEKEDMSSKLEKQERYLNQFKNPLDREEWSQHWLTINKHLAIFTNRLENNA